MKRFAALFAIASIPFLLNACQESNTEPVVTTKFNVSKKNITLDAATPRDSSFAFLECGCNFALTIEDFSGDTSAIHYTQRDASTAKVRFAIDITGDAAAAPGVYSAKLALLGVSSTKGSFRDTISVLYTRN